MNTYNNNYWGNPGYPVNNYGYNRPKLPDPTNPLTKEQMNLLKQKAPEFTLAISQIDSLKAICTHRNNEGETLIQNNDGSGTVTCSICGTRFKPTMLDQDSVTEIFRAAIDCLETIKIMYMDIPDDVAKGFFQMIPFLEKAPQMYKIANDHYSRYSNGSVMSRDYNNGGNAFNLFAAMMNPGMMMGMGMPQQVPYGQGMGMPAQNGMMTQPNMAPPVQEVSMGMPNGNPFDVGSTPSMDAAKTVTDNKQYKL